ncbi:unnamed protein product [Rotaria magnacalcarata]
MDIDTTADFKARLQNMIVYQDILIKNNFLAQSSCDQEFSTLLIFHNDLRRKYADLRAQTDQLDQYIEHYRAESERKDKKIQSQSSQILRLTQHNKRNNERLTELQRWFDRIKDSITEPSTYNKLYEILRNSHMSEGETTADLSDRYCTGDELDVDYSHMPKVVSQSAGIGEIKRLTDTNDIDLKLHKSPVNISAASDRNVNKNKPEPNQLRTSPIPVSSRKINLIHTQSTVFFCLVEELELNIDDQFWSKLIDDHHEQKSLSPINSALPKLISPTIEQKTLTPSTPASNLNSNSSPSNITKLHSRGHNFISRNILIPETCCCLKRIHFGKSAYRCQGCNALCHTGCKENCTTLCLPNVKTPNRGAVDIIKVAMAPKDPEWTPKFVSLSENCPEGRTYFDWNDKGIEEWKANAIKFQDTHVKDNNRTEWFTYKSEDRDALELRILMAICGFRTPQEGSKAAPSCPLRTFKRDERLHARKLKKVIIKHSNSSENIHLNIIYISTATKVEEDKQFYASEEPVFVINDHRKLIDKDGRTYANFQDYKENNKLPKAATLAPKNGTYTPAQTIDGRVPLELGETPATSLLKRAKDVVDTVVMVGGMVLAVTGVVTFFAPALFSATAMSVIQAGSFFLTTYGVVGAATSIHDKTQHDESIRTEVFVLISSALSTYSGILRTQAIKYAREGKTYAEVMEKIGKAQRAMFAVANVFTIVSSSGALISSIFDLMAKRERTWLDYYQFCMGLFMLVNVCTKPITIKGIFDSEQMQHLNEMKNSLESDDAKEEMSRMLAEHSTSDQKAYMIRNLNKIENPTEFFELIRKTRSTVTCTADGLTVNNMIDISPLSYNDIGKAVFIEKFNQISKSESAALHSSFMDEFDQYIPDENKENFESRLENIKTLPVEQQRETMRNLVNELTAGGGPPQEAFDASWNRAQTAYRDNLDQQVNEMIGHLQQGSTGPGQEDDFTQLGDLARRQMHGVATPEEQKELQQQLDKCTNHRKEYFFKSSAIHRDDANNPENNAALRVDIKTFTNAKNERLCYRINVEDVKQTLRNTFQVLNHEDIIVHDKRIFDNMKTGDYDRLNRVLTEYTTRGPNLLSAAIHLGNDPAFVGQVNTPHDIASITEALEKQRASLPRGQRQEFLNGIATGTGEHYDRFRNDFNGRINAINALPDDIKSQWSSTLSMAYHWWKHEDQFRTNQPLTIDEYFREYSNNIFKTENIIGTSHTQAGGIKQSYTRSFGARIHVGFTFGENRTKASHFPK